MALIYGGAQSTNISEIVQAFQSSVLVDGQDTLVLAGIALLMVGLGFKVAAVPFHVWTPDVYQGAPTAVTAFMASVGKAAAFAAMLRVLVIALPFHRDDWGPAVWVLAVLSLVVGSVLAVVQSDVKRMLAYSSISHAGFILVGVEAASHRAGETQLGNGMPSVDDLPVAVRGARRSEPSPSSPSSRGRTEGTRRSRHSTASAPGTRCWRSH